MLLHNKNIICSFIISAAFVLASLFSIVQSASADAENLLTLHVSHKASGMGDGSESRPYATIKEALGRAGTAKQPVRIAIEPGTYREGGLRITRRDWPTVVESAGKEQVIISGSDVWTDWETRGKTIVAEWPYDWGNYELDAGFPKRDHDSFRPVGKRSEMVFVDGQLLKQVVESKQLEPGSFMVDLNAQELVVQLPKGVNHNDALVEVGMRPNLLGLIHAKDVTLRKLTFQHAVSHPHRNEGGLESWAVFIGGEHVKGMTNYESNPERDFVERVLVEDCVFHWNNRSGFTVANAKHIELNRCHFDNNGISGVGANRVRYIKFKDSTFNGNNWRKGLWGHVTGWGPAGTKMLFISDMEITGCEFNDNYATGLWLDTSVNHVVIDQSDMKGNWGTGFYYEHNQGPALIKNSRIIENGYNDGSREIRISDGGILFAESQDLTVDNCSIVDNVNYQIGVRTRDRKGVCYWSERRISGVCRNLTVTNSFLHGSSFDEDNAPSFYTPREHRLNTLIARHVHADEQYYIDHFITTYKGSNNLFYNPITARVFSTGPNFGYDRISLEDWIKMTNQDKDSAWAPR